MQRLEIARDATDEVTGAPPVLWAMERLRSAFVSAGGSARVLERTEPGGPDAVLVSVSGISDRMAVEALTLAGVSPPEQPESFAIVPVRSPRPALRVCGTDPRGLMYAILELADRVEHAEDPIAALRIEEPAVERPANAVRSVTRLFCSELEDKPWFLSETFWDRYLSMLAAQRFNRFSLTLGLGYNYNRDVSDAYLYFAYPFLLTVPGYDVRVPQLPAEERERNLAMLRFISERTTARGLDFQLGLWTHAYEWIDSPNAHHTIEGLTPETHAPYCREALQMLLETCPAIGGVTLRIHGESGVPEGSPGFWGTVFEGLVGAGRTVGIDLHAKGLDEGTLRSALETGLPITVSPKFWAEHMGLPYHQAAIRERERVPREDPSDLSEWHRAMRVSEGSRPFTRYGYGDFLREDRSYDLVFRLWAGTQRVLLWGDPVMAAAYGRAASLAGSQGLEWCEPLTFKGREGSGLAGSRTGYADPSLVPRDDWEKFAYAYRLFGRLSYDPDAPAEVWRRPLGAHFGAASLDAESALASASRILPLVTVAHHPSASNNYYWPEIYTDMPVVWSDGATRPHPYLDTPEPRRFGTVSPLDPEVFSSVAEFVAELRAGTPSGRVTALDVAGWLEDLAEDADRRRTSIDGRALDAEARRWVVDIAILAALGRFFAGKFRAAVAYELFARTGDRETLLAAVRAYRAARRAWVSVAELATGVYVRDLTYGPQRRIRGHWADRLPAIDADLGDMEGRLALADGRSAGGDGVGPIEAPVTGPPDVEVRHVAPTTFRPGRDLHLEIELGGTQGDVVRNVAVRYRPMNQALPYAATEMDRDGPRFEARIPGAELDGRYPLAYAFVLRDGSGTAWRHPGLGPELSQQPYFVVRSQGARAHGTSRGGSGDWVYSKT